MNQEKLCPFRKRKEIRHYDDLNTEFQWFEPCRRDDCMVYQWKERRCGLVVEAKNERDQVDPFVLGTS